MELRQVPLQLALPGQPLRAGRDLHSATASASTPPQAGSERYTAQQSPAAGISRLAAAALLSCLDAIMPTMCGKEVHGPKR